jgi:hypothetical protein
MRTSLDSSFVQLRLDRARRAYFMQAWAMASPFP